MMNVTMIMMIINKSTIPFIPYTHARTSQDITEDAYTLNDVVSEIRDKATRARLQVLPYELHMKDVNPEALKFG